MNSLDTPRYRFREEQPAPKLAPLQIKSRLYQDSTSSEGSTDDDKVQRAASPLIEAPSQEKKVPVVRSYECKRCRQHFGKEFNAKRHFFCVTPPQKEALIKNGEKMQEAIEAVDRGTGTQLQNDMVNKRIITRGDVYYLGHSI